MKQDLSSIRIGAIFLLLVGALFGTTVQAHAETTTVTPPPVHTNVGVKDAVEDTFSDAPIMLSVAQCESGFQQYRSNGTTFTGAGGLYVGVFQIAKGHTASAKSMGMDIYTLEGNLKYARYLYDKQGTWPWSGCVKKPVTAARPSTTPVAKTTPTKQVASVVHTKPVLSKTLKLNSRGTEVLALQKLLNASGFIIAKSGAGSKGNETDNFGQLTKEAVQRFQCVHNIVCSGSESTNGYGMVGPTTRAALLKEDSQLSLR